MVTYEEFLKQNKNLKELQIIYLGAGEQHIPLFSDTIMALINGNPEEYLDVARKAKSLDGVTIYSEGTANIHDRMWYKQVRGFIKNCRDDITISNADIGEATKADFFKAEEIIETVVDQIDPSWTVKQKLAFVHFKMGELVTYLADAESHHANAETTKKYANCKNIWKSLTTKTSICTGITYIQRTILARAGVKTHELSSGTHSFMLTETEDGNIITDATWDLRYTTFGCKPQYFGKTYEELRQIDGDKSNAHKLKNVPQNVIGISADELRSIYQSIGIIGKDGKFHSKVSEILDEMKRENFTMQEERIQKLWQLIEEKLGDKFSHIDECRSMFEDCLRWHGVDLKNVTSEYVYSVADTDFERPQLVISIIGKDNNIMTKIIDPNGNKVVDISLQELQNGYRYHQNNTREPFWANELNSENMKAENEIPQNGVDARN